VALTLVTGATDEPIRLDEAKLHVRRTDIEDDDEYFDTFLIPAVRARAEQQTGRQLLTATWDWVLDRFPCDATEALIVPKAPLQHVSSISYIDSDGATQTWSSSNYLVDAPGAVTVATDVYKVLGTTVTRGRITPAYGLTWPTTRSQMNAVTIRFLAGYGTASDVPYQLKRAMLLDLGTLFENREDMVVGQGYVISPFPYGAESIYRAFKSY
jgi:uncharacterized phiE125 gp8 family phage protein